MGRRALTEEEKLERAKEKEMQKEMQEKEFVDFANSKLNNLVKDSTLKKFHNIIKDYEELDNAQVMEMLIEAFNDGIIVMNVETKREYSIGMK